MNEYIIYFEIFGKKMKTTVLAESKQHAKTNILDSVIFHKIECNEKLYDEQIKEFLKGFNIK